MELTIKGSRAEIMGLLATFAAGKVLDGDSFGAAMTPEYIERVAQGLTNASTRIDNPAAPVDAIRPESEQPHVMTLAELRALPVGAKAYVEEMSGSLYASGWHTKNNASAWVDDNGMRYDDSTSLIPDDYDVSRKIALRAWSSKPTIEQMAATPWEAQDA